ncbi:MAG TPA: DUF2127 domain-containing protein [Bryobacteraceae bacterium]|nr:DUF2127 domain-containing protein [Bryobacteraceae bacterium]
MARRRRLRRPHPPPQALDQRSSAAGLRAIAAFEGLKGVLVLALGLGLLGLIHKDLEQVAENMLSHLHLNAEHRLGKVILHAASTTTDARLWAIAGGAVAYSAVRFIEAWGLWNRRVWAEWFALLSCALYLPVEIVKLGEHPNWIHFVVFFGNLAIFLYMLWVRVAAYRAAVPESQVSAG